MRKRIIALVIIRPEWVSRRNATIHINIITVCLRSHVVFLFFIVVSYGEKHTERPLLDLCVTNGVRYKCAMTGQNTSVLLGTAAAIYNAA